MAAKSAGKKTARSQRASDEKAARIDELTSQLADGIQGLADDEAWRGYLDFQSSMPHYSFGNCMLVRLQCPGATMVMPYGEPGKPGTWMNIGRHAISGQKALYIRKPSFRKVKAEDSGDGQEHSFLRFIWVPVFDVSQTEGEPLPEGEICRLLEGDDPQGLLGLVTAFAGSRGYSLELVDEIDGTEANGDCDWDLKRIRVCGSGRSSLQQAKTAVHEAAHMLLHPGSELERGHKELEAESVAYVVLRYLGLDSSGYSFGYVLGWSGHSSATARDRIIRESGKRIQEAAQAILEGVGAIDARDFAREGDGASAAA